MRWGPRRMGNKIFGLSGALLNVFSTGANQRAVCAAAASILVTKMCLHHTHPYGGMAVMTGSIGEVGMLSNCKES